MGDDHPLNVSVSQAGQAHTSPRAELLAIVIAIEQRRWPIHICSDNLGFVTAAKRLLAGDPTPTMKDNRDLWRRIKFRLNAKQKHIKITWVKGHAEDKDIQQGKSTLAHQNGNDSADVLANTGSR